MFPLGRNSSAPAKPHSTNPIDTWSKYLYIQAMFGISGEHLLILGLILLIFGPRRLPELGSTLGKAFRNFKDAISGVEEAQFRKLDQPQTHPTKSNAVQQSQNSISDVPIEKQEEART